MEHQFNLGDLVKLKSGSPHMTVTRIWTTEEGEVRVECRWFVAGADFKTERFALHELRASNTSEDGPRVRVL